MLGKVIKIYRGEGGGGAWASPSRLELTKHVPSNCKYKFDCTECNSNQKWNKELRHCECNCPISHHVCEKGYGLKSSYMCL